FLDGAARGAYLLGPWTCGAVTGLGLLAWAYDRQTVRRWAERVMLVLIVIYLVVGVLAGEHLADWIKRLPEPLGQFVLLGFEAFDRYNPFAVLRFWLEERSLAAWDRLLGVEGTALMAAGLLVIRDAGR